MVMDIGWGPSLQPCSCSVWRYDNQIRGAEGKQVGGYCAVLSSFFISQFCLKANREGPELYFGLLSLVAELYNSGNKEVVVGLFLCFWAPGGSLGWGHGHKDGT